MVKRVQQAMDDGATTEISARLDFAGLAEIY